MKIVKEGKFTIDLITGGEGLGFDDLSSIENPSHELIFSDKLEMNFWFDQNSLSQVQWVRFL